MPKLKFAYKHPTFGRTDAVRQSEPYKNSVYYLWWEFLRLNDDYKECCSKGGKGKLSKLYEDFGDVFSCDFKAWWTTDNRGARLFAEQPLPAFSIVDPNDIINQDEVIYLKVPLSLPKRYLTSEFKKILNKHHGGKTGVRTNKNSTAMYPIVGHVDIKSIKLCLKVYNATKVSPKPTKWQIGRDISEISFSYVEITDKPKKLDADTKHILTSSVSRILNKARKMIKGTSDGKFPVLR